MAQITLLHPIDGKHTGKAFGIDSNGEITKSDYQAGTYFSAELVECDSISSLSAILSDPAQTKSTIVIRGLPIEEADLSQKVRRRIHRLDQNQLETSEHPFVDQPQPWLMIDIDKYRLPVELDLIDHTEQSIEHVVRQLPPEFHEVSFFWQLSGSAGVYSSRDISVHLWFWLSQSVSTYALRQWAKASNAVPGSRLIDPALYNPVQPHYVTDPLFVQPLKDPVSLRSSLVRKEHDEVQIDLNHAVPAVPISGVPGSGSAREYSLGTETHGYENILSELGDHSGGDGFYNPLLRATASVVAEKGVEWIQHNIERVIQDLQERIDEADQSKVGRNREEIRRYRSRELNRPGF